MKQANIIAQGIVHSQPHDRFGYFGWPSIARLGDGTLVAGASGMRMAHVCPWGRTTLFVSRDEGKTWTPPIVVNDTPLDDRDAGVVSLGGQKLLVSWFTLPKRYFEHGFAQSWSEADRNIAQAMVDAYPADIDEKWAGSYVRVSEDGGNTWGDIHRVPVTTPHGPILLKNGKLMYYGKEYMSKDGAGYIGAYVSSDDGATWEKYGETPFPDYVNLSNFYEPHIIELPDGRLLAQIRYQDYKRANPYPFSFSIFQSISSDGGKTWTTAVPLDVSGSPPHLMRHSSGALVCVYGRREEPFGEIAMISRDDGATWDKDYMLREGVDGDLGYPASVELADGSILTVYYHKLNSGENCSILYTRWRL